MTNKLDAYIVGDSLKISVNNLRELEEIILEIMEKEKELQLAVLKLRRYNLEINFQQIHLLHQQRDHIE